MLKYWYTIARGHCPSRVIPKWSRRRSQYYLDHLYTYTYTGVQENQLTLAKSIR